MNLASIDTSWLVVALVLLNLFLLVLFPAADRWWHPPVLLWVALLFTLLLLHVGYQYSGFAGDPALEQGVPQDGSTDALLWMQLQEAEEEERLYKSKTFRLLGAQSFISLFVLAIGYHQTGKIMYRKAMISFVVICLLYLVLEFIFLFYGFGL